MRRKLFLIICLVAALPTVGQQVDTSFLNSLDKDATQVYYDILVKTRRELFFKKIRMDELRAEAEAQLQVSTGAVYFLSFLGRLEKGLPLSKRDSGYVGEEEAITCNSNFGDKHAQNTTVVKRMYIVLSKDELSFLQSSYFSASTADFPFLELYPRLAKMYADSLLVICTRVAPPPPNSNVGASAPEIHFPPPRQAGQDINLHKKSVAAYWYGHTVQLSKKCGMSDADLKQYYAVEKKRIPNGDLDKIIDFRKKLAIFIQGNCK